MFDKYDISLSLKQQAVLSGFSNKSADDSKYICKILDFIYPERQELALLSVTGLPSRNPNYEPVSTQTMNTKTTKFIEGKTLNFHIHKFSLIWNILTKLLFFSNVTNAHRSSRYRWSGLVNWKIFEVESHHQNENY